MDKSKLETPGEIGFFMKFTKWIEKVGNKMPHPAFLFLILTAVIMIASAIFSGAAVEVSKTGTDGKIVVETVKVVNILSKSGIANFLSSMLTNYKNLSTLSLLIMVVMGTAVAEQSGFFSAILRKTILGTPRVLIVYMVSLVGICANITGDAGMILGATLGGIVYKAIGRNPWIGIITGYAAAAAGYTANLIPASLDANLSSITQQVLDTAGINYTIHALSNYIFMFVSTFVLAAVVSIISETFLTKFLGDKKGKLSPEELEKAKLTDDENRGIKYALIAIMVLLGLGLLSTVPSNGLLRNESGKLLPSSPLMSSIIPIIFIAFTTVGSAYGMGSGVIKKPSDIIELMRKGVVAMSSMWIVFFFVAQMLYVFNESNLATIIAVKGETGLRAIGLTGLPLMLLFIILVSFVNLFMYSGSAKWLLFAPLFIPMFSNLGIHPATAQLAYRIGDSVTNSLTPLNVCLIATVQILNNYRDPELNPEPAGVGTILSTVFVFAMAILVTFMILFSIFWIFKIPVGIGM